MFGCSSSAVFLFTQPFLSDLSIASPPRIITADMHWTITSSTALPSVFILFFEQNHYLFFFRHAGGIALRMDMSVWWLVHPFFKDWNISTPIWWITTKCCTDIQGFQKIKPTDFGDPPWLRPSVPPWSWHVWFRLKCLNKFWMDSIRGKHSVFVDYGDPLKFHLVPSSSSQKVVTLYSLVYHQTPSKLMTFLSALPLLTWPYLNTPHFMACSHAKLGW